MSLSPQHEDLRPAAPTEIYLAPNPALGCDAWQWPEVLQAPFELAPGQPDPGPPVRYVLADMLTEQLAAKDEAMEAALRLAMKDKHEEVAKQREAHITDMRELLSEYWDETRPTYDPGARQDLEMKRHNDYFNHKAIQYTGSPLKAPEAGIPSPAAGYQGIEKGGQNGL